MNKDLDHLRILAILHYVFAALCLLGSLFAGIYIVLGIAMLSGALDDGGGSNPPPPELGWIFIVMGGAAMFIGVAVSACIAVAGRKLWVHRGGHTFCTIVAALECLSLPFGTILGVFTLVVLVRPSVRDLFAGHSPHSVTTN